MNPIRVASVSFLNAKPLLEGLGENCEIELSLDVPSKLIDRLRDGSADVALLPTIDYQMLDGLRIVPAGGIGCDGPTLTVRLFSRIPIAEIATLSCDTDSHTSIALARIILAESHGIQPEMKPLAAGGDSLLLIGDKVICEQPLGYEYQLDLGEAWKRLTGLPFVFAVWTARADVALGELPSRLETAKRRGLENVDALVRDFALPRGWPADIAREYLTRYLKYDIGETQLKAIRRFHQLAGYYGLIPSPPRPLRMI
ncbi:MAG: menaquinone biosynthesis protein [Phycisphaerae bacterium]|nr:menaquinone biosynthesis protein [Phycisphaerae bacterium]